MASTGAKVTGTVYYDGGGTWNTTPTTTNLNISDNIYAIASAGDDPCVLGDQDFSSIVGTGVTINGIIVSVEGNNATAASTVNYSVSLSKDGGGTFPFTKTSSFTSTTDVVTAIGSSSDLWGTTWVDTNFDFGSFALSIERTGGTGNLRLDLVTVEVFYTAAGGAANSGFFVFM